MKRLICSISIITLFVTGCNNTPKTPNTAIDVARTFIKDILDSDLKNAETFVLKDSTNKQYFDLFKKDFQSKDKSELEGYKNADIIIKEINNVNDSVTIINYSNSYKISNSSKLKIIKSNGIWMVDLKYTFSGNM